MGVLMLVHVLVHVGLSHKGHGRIGHTLLVVDEPVIQLLNELLLLVT